MIQAGIIGGAGYTAGELIRLLLVHSKVEINFVYSTSSAGKKLSAIHQDLVGSTEQLFTDKINTDVDILFLCLGHGNSKAFFRKKHLFKAQQKSLIYQTILDSYKMQYFQINALYMACQN